MQVIKERRRKPDRSIGVHAARAVRRAIGYARPTDLPIERIASMRGVRIRHGRLRGARAHVVRVGARGIISLAEGLTPAEERWAIAHELGHFEAHATLEAVYAIDPSDVDGRESEANAFAAELLMPEDLYA